MGFGSIVLAFKPHTFALIKCVELLVWNFFG